MSTRPNGPSMSKIFDLLEGRLGVAEQKAMRDLAISDPEVAESIEWARRFLAISAAAPLHSPPPELHRRLLDAFDSWAGMSPVSGWIDGSLVLDSRTLRGRGLRSGSSDQTVHLMYDSPLGSILLEITPAHVGFVDLVGRIAFKVAPSEQARGEVDVAVTRDSTLRAASRTGHEGQFSLKEVRADANELWITGADERIRVELDLLSI